MSGPGRVVLAVAVPAAAGAVVFHLWPLLGLPALGVPLDAPFPGLWRWFFAVWPPALFPAFSLAHALLLRWAARADPGAAAVARAAGRWDRRSYALLALLPLLMLAWGARPGWRHALGAVYVVLLFAKVGLLVVTLGRGPFRPAPGAAADAPALGWLLLLPGLLYLFLAPYVITAVSTAGDEQVYLLNTHSLWADGDVDIRNNVRQRDWAGFYWGRPVGWRLSFVGFPTLLLPGYALGAGLLPAYPLAGRLGAVLTIGAFAALLGPHVYRLSRELGASRPAAFWAWLVVALTPPVVVNAGHVYPEVPAACAAVMAARALLRIPGRSWPALALVAGAVAFMVALKERYGPLGLGLLVWAAARLAARRVLAGALLLAATLAGVAYLAWRNPVPALFPILGRLEDLLGVLSAWNRWMPRAALGLLADQEFGLLAYGPHFTLALVGLVPLARRRPGAAAGLAATVLFALGVVVKFRWMQWDAGWTPPPRFVVAAAPLLAPCVAEAFDRARGRVLAALNTVWLAWAGAAAVCLALVPFWRYNNLDGRTTLVQLAGERLGLDLARFLPSLRAPTAWTWGALALGGVLAGAWAVACAWRRREGDPGWGAGAVWLGPARSAGLVAAVALGWVALAAGVPTWAVEAEAMRHERGLPHGSYAFQPVVWVMRQEGELTERIVTWRGLTEITVVAGGFTTTGAAPTLTLLLDDQAVASWRLRSGQGWWDQDSYVARVPTRFRRPRLRLRLTDLADDRRADPPRVQHAYVDRVRLRRVAPAP